MERLADQVWVVLATIAFSGVVAVLHCVAASMRNATYLHDLRVRVHELRRQRLERLRELAEAGRGAAGAD